MSKQKRANASKRWSVKQLIAAARGKDLAAANAREALEKLKDDIRLARKYFHGYEAEDGFDLRRLALLKSDKLKGMTRRVNQIRHTLASNYVIVHPRSDSARKALAREVNRPITRAVKSVPVGVAPGTKIKIETKNKRSSIRLERITKSGAMWQEQTWYFKDYASKKDRSLDTEDGVSAAYERMIESGDLYPQGFYVLVTGEYGNVGAPGTMYGLQREMTRLFIRYETEPGKVKQFIAVRLVGFTESEALAEYDAREAARLLRQQQRERERRKYRYQESRRVKYFCPSCRTPYRGVMSPMIKCRKCGFKWIR